MWDVWWYDIKLTISDCSIFRHLLNIIPLFCLPSSYPPPPRLLQPANTINSNINLFYLFILTFRNIHSTFYHGRLNIIKIHQSFWNMKVLTINPKFHGLQLYLLIIVWGRGEGTPEKWQKCHFLLFFRINYYNIKLS